MAEGSGEDGVENRPPARAEASGVDLADARAPALPPPQALRFCLQRPFDAVPQDRGAQTSGQPGRLMFLINSRTWRNSWILQVILTDHGWARVPVDQREWHLWWCAGQANTHAIRELLPWQRLNKFPKSSTLTLKANLSATVAEAAAKYGRQHFGFLPETFTLPVDWDEFEDARDADETNEQIWIVKPYAAYCGRGIFLLPNGEEMPPEVLEDRAVVSRYIERPYLINRLKSDVRLYVLVTSWHPLTVYLNANGLVRFATDPYTLDVDSLDNRNAHITNYSLNKRSSNFRPTHAVDEDGTGSKWTLDALRAHLEQAVGRGAADAMWRAVDDIVVKTCIAAEPAMQAAYEKYVPDGVKAQPHAGVFQLFGFDVMLDANLRPWLLEVNLDPALATDSPLDLKVRGAVEGARRVRDVPRRAQRAARPARARTPTLLPTAPPTRAAHGAGERSDARRCSEPAGHRGPP